ncbi:paraquat-inducible protein A [Wenxinia saemankumensis]|uniref:Paraquat-inducible protein A n=1 Tax=Wenxinia saemankumensis TaxID=1447782 RepID=A0A1M6A8I9_9RHOB|nr:paraquat-inducible protein A [Wenxinia saemankumensis]SHI32854.1 paraquat-inducible protein A [Wenxinia saemankumensis]
MSGEEALTARDAGLVACRRCTRVWPRGRERCGRCGARLVSRDPGSLSRVWAWWVAGLMAYVPANIYPMLITDTLVSRSEATIVGGAIELIQHDALGIAIIILIASVGIPIGKFVAVAYLALSVQNPARLNAHRRHHLLEVVEYIGRWSMIDVFVVAILSALVQLSVVARIDPGPAALAFALSVVFTMLAAQAFDPRLIWDRIEADAEADGPEGRSADEAGPTPRGEQA